MVGPGGCDQPMAKKSQFLHVKTFLPNNFQKLYYCLNAVVVYIYFPTHQCKKTSKTTLRQVAREDIIYSWQQTSSGDRWRGQTSTRLKSTVTEELLHPKIKILFIDDQQSLNFELSSYNQRPHVVYVWINNLPKIQEIYGRYQSLVKNKSQLT